MKKIKILAGALALCAIAGVNVWNATATMIGSELELDDIEALGGDDGDSPRLNKPWLWFSQGLTADESPNYYTCDVSNGQFTDIKNTTTTGKVNYTNSGTDYEKQIGTIDGVIEVQQTSTYGSQHDYAYTATVTVCDGGTTNCTPTRPNPCNSSSHNR
ncbi:MAG: hypothetical protein PUC50_15235 [Bacteroidales bacterium]|nr:hypothetical protein [Bacteroidales bacterium]